LLLLLLLLLLEACLTCTSGRFLQQQAMGLVGLAARSLRMLTLVLLGQGTGRVGTCCASTGGDRQGQQQVVMLAMLVMLP
jgi:hypothetical protein